MVLCRRWQTAAPRCRSPETTTTPVTPTHVNLLKPLSFRQSHTDKDNQLPAPSFLSIPPPLTSTPQRPPEPPRPAHALRPRLTARGHAAGGVGRRGVPRMYAELPGGRGEVWRHRCAPRSIGDPERCRHRSSACPRRGTASR